MLGQGQYLQFLSLPVDGGQLIAVCGSEKQAAHIGQCQHEVPPTDRKASFLKQEVIMSEDNLLGDLGGRVHRFPEAPVNHPDATALKQNR